MVGGAKEGWLDFDKEYPLFSRKHERPEDCSSGDDLALKRIINVPKRGLGNKTTDTLLEIARILILLFA